MKQQLHTRLNKEQIITILERYLSSEMPSRETQQKLGLKKAQFFRVVKSYREKSDAGIQRRKRKNPPRCISDKAEKKILEELEKDKELIENKDMPIHTYNYSAIRDTLKEKHSITVSVPTIITRAKDNDYYLEKKERRIHDRMVISDFIGELVQHDSSHHQWSPYMDKKLYLITSLDDYSRLLLYADFVERETSWYHITALQKVFLQYGCPLKYYADQHSIFRYVKNRDKESNWVNYTKFTDDVDTQWRHVLRVCNVEPLYALSSQAKGKIERPYRWLQDRIVRIAAKEKLTQISELREVLQKLVHTYNTVWVHSTTHEIPIMRFEDALNNNLCLFKPLQSVKPNTDIRDIFCLRVERKVDGYLNVRFENMTFTLSKATPRTTIEIHIVPDVEKGIAELRFWHNNTFLDSRMVKLQDLKTVQF